MKRKLIFVGLILSVALTLVGCQNTAPPEKGTDKKVDSKLSEPTDPTSPQQPVTSETPQTKESTSLQMQEPEQPTAKEPAQSEVPVGTPSQVPPNSEPSPVNPENKGALTPQAPTAPEKPVLREGNISLQVGDTLPEFALTDLQGRKLTASSIVGKHQLTLINFWRTT